MGVVMGLVIVLVGVYRSVIVPMKSTHSEHLSRDVQRRHQEFVAA